MNNKINNQATLVNYVKAGAFIIGSVSANGTVSFSANPVIHPSATSARAECARLAAQDTEGKLFIFVQLKGAVGTMYRPSIVHI